MDQFPFELQTSILKCLLAVSRRPAPPLFSVDLDRSEDESDAEPVIMEWIEDPRSTPLFPYNVASVSKSWRDITSQIPECWTRVVFDVAQDPAPFLDAFSWSKNLTNIEVLVFTSSGRSDNIQEPLRQVQDSVEKERISRIVQALRPHIARCKFVKFDVTYSSYLPPPTIFFLQDMPHLEQLSLNCRFDDIVVGNHPWTTTTNMDRPPLATAFPKLKMLSLTGFWFMYLGLSSRTPTWFKRIKTGELMELHVSQFEFVEAGRYTMDNFVAYLQNLRRCNYYYFRDLSLSYKYHGPELEFDEDEDDEIIGNFHYHSVSGDFLAHLYAISQVSGDESLSFDGCQVPRISQSYEGYFLTLTNVDGNSLRHVLDSWNGGELDIRSCPSFDDKFLSWFGAEIEYTLSYTDQPRISFRAERLMSLSITDCPNFTPRALRNFIKARNDAAFAAENGSEMSEIASLNVGGRAPILSQEDKDWFVQNEETTMVHWYTSLDEENWRGFRAMKRYSGPEND